ncbi:MAG: hypothetical protein OQK55_03155 [Thermoanaerobaculales bacterium]|nr:hypothetical protein [Thermoanaerobaculales bacterium]
MDLPSRFGAVLRSESFRKWAIRIVVVLLVFEVVYVVGANIFLRSGLLQQLINKKPEKTSINWDSAVTYLPGFVTVEGFTLRSQTKKDQVYVHVVEADARISLIKLAFKTIHIRGVDARDVDFRYRERLDRPPKAGQEEEPIGPPLNLEYYPEIPGFTNPPDPKPEDLYPRKKKKRPWTIKITGADVEGPVKVAFNGFRLDGDGSVGGGVTVKPRKTITIHRGRLALDRTTVTLGPETLTDKLAIHADLRFGTFPAKGAKFGDVIGGVTGDLSLAGRLGEKAAVSQEITPGITTFGAGVIAANLSFKKGVLRAGSRYTLESDAFHVMIMGLDATGSAMVSGSTVKESGDHVTSAKISFGDFEFADSNKDTADITGTGLEVNARWNGFSLAERVPASHAEVVLPRTLIHDVSAFNDLIPGESTLSLQSGTGDVEARLEVNDRIAVGTLDLVAEEIVLKTKDVPLYGDLEVHAKLNEGNLPAKEFNLSGTTILLDNIVDEALSERKQEKLEAWFCDVELEEGTVTFGKPMAAHGRLGLKMRDSRPVVAMLKDLGVKLKGLSLMPNINDIDGAMDVDFGKGYIEVENLDLTGKDLEVLGWIHVRDKKANGRLFTKYGILAAGVALDQGKAKVYLGKPRKWFEDQQGPPPESVDQEADGQRQNDVPNGGDGVS